MEHPFASNEGLLDLSKFSLLESCIWLLEKLHTTKHLQEAYCIPYSSYVLTWPNSVPLTAIITAQSPYPNDIFPPIAAAMSFDSDLCMASKMRRPLPPTIEVLANDMFINANMNKEDCITILKYGWALIEKGILLINESVFEPSGSTGADRESADQLNVIIKLLRETEKHGKRTVDIYAFGEAGHRMARDLCSWFKSDVVKLSKHANKHPAGVARRFQDLNHPKCHMENPTFSKSLFKHLSNHVAFSYTMAKKSELEIRIQRQADVINSVLQQFPQLKDCIKETMDIEQEFLNALELEDKQKLKDSVKQLIAVQETLHFRFGVAASLVGNIQASGHGISPYATRSAPSMNTVSATPLSLSKHTGGSVASNSKVEIRKLTLSRSSKAPSAVSTDTSSHVVVSPPPSVTSIKSGSAPIKLSIRKSSIKSSVSTTSATTDNSEQSTASTIKDVQTTPNNQSSLNDIEEEQKTPKSRSVLGARFRKQQAVVGSTSSESSGNKKMEQITSSSDTVDIGSILTKDIINQLSSVEAVVQAHKDDWEDDEDCAEAFSNIQNDISNKKVYNFVVVKLVKHIKKDISTYSNFDFSRWVYDTSKKSDTFDFCKEEFQF